MNFSRMKGTRIISDRKAVQDSCFQKGTSLDSHEGLTGVWR